MRSCRVCMSLLGEPLYSAEAPSITSMSELINAPTKIFACDICGHVQGPDLPNQDSYYADEYKISLESDDHDQLYEMTDAGSVYRTDHQAKLVLKNLAIPKGAKFLDFGAAKAATLRKVIARRPDIEHYVFDVSDDYRPHWKNWIPDSQSATWQLPDTWRNSFDFISAHFVFEHITDPLASLRQLCDLLKPGGNLFFTVPNAIANPADILVCDHVNHFTQSSLAVLLEKAELESILIDESQFAGAFVIVAKRSTNPTAKQPAVNLSDIRATCSFWNAADKRLRSVAKKCSGRPSAIYGSGVYGLWIASRVGRDIVCFADQSPHQQRTKRLGLQVFDPKNLPDDIEVLYAGLNPHRAHAILDSHPAFIDRKLKIVFLDHLPASNS